jgi:hypothetical protein
MVTHPSTDHCEIACRYAGMSPTGDHAIEEVGAVEGFWWRN